MCLLPRVLAMRRKVEVLEHIEPEHDGDALHRVIISELTLPFIIEAGHCIADAPSPEFLGYRAAGRRHPLSTRGGREARGFDVYAYPNSQQKCRRSVPWDCCG